MEPSLEGKWYASRDADATFSGPFKLPRLKKWLVEYEENGEVIFSWRYYTMLFPRCKRKFGENCVARLKKFCK